MSLRHVFLLRRYPRSSLCIAVLTLLALHSQRHSMHTVFSYVGFVTLAHVQHVQLLECVPDPHRPDWPRPASSLPTENQSYTTLTVVIVTARPEFKRLPTTLAALLCHLDARHIAEVHFLVPPADVALLEPYLSGQQAKHWPWPVALVADDVLLTHRHTLPYRLQMMFKLFVAQIVHTEHYLVLDSDCVALWPIHVEHLLHTDGNSTRRRALTPMETKSSHLGWWSQSELLLQTSLESCLSRNSMPTPAMGVTPIILSRTIALRTLCRLQKLYGDEHFLTSMARLTLRQLLRGEMWTEYTMYYLTARCTQLFDRFHFVQHEPSTTVPVLPSLTGLSIWSASDWTVDSQKQLVAVMSEGLSWRRKEMREASGRALFDNSTDSHALFTVLQGRHGVDPGAYHRLFFPIYRSYLEEQGQMTQLVAFLDRMTKELGAE